MTARELLEPGRGPRQGPHEPLPVQSKRGPALDKLCLNETVWGETGGHTAQPTGISGVYLESYAAYLCLILKTPAISPMPGQKNARNVDAFHWVSPPPKQPAASGRGAALIRPGLLEAASWAEVF